MRAHNGILVIINLNRFTLHELCIQFYLYIYLFCVPEISKRSGMRLTIARTNRNRHKTHHKQKGNLMSDSLKKGRATDRAAHQPTNNKRMNLKSAHLFVYITFKKKLHARSHCGA